MQNKSQIALLTLINALVGSLLGIERSIMPMLAEQQFGIKNNMLLLAFIMAFGVSKMTVNYWGGKWAMKVSRKKLLLIGWSLAIPVPFLLIFAQTWWWILLANVFLGLQQGLAWSMTLLMKIELAGERNRGLVAGLNEFAGYTALALSAYLSAWIAKEYGVFPYPFFLAGAMVVAALLLSTFWVKEITKSQEKNQIDDLQNSKSYFACSVNCIIKIFQEKNQRTVVIAGLVNNLNDALAWGVFPLLLISKNFGLEQIGLIAAVYPLTWGIFQLFTGKWSDVYGRKPLMVWGMVLQGIALILFPWANAFLSFIFLSAVLGLGTAMVYPVFVAAIADNALPSQKAIQLGVYRFWRDGGFVVGALFSALLLIRFEAGMTIIIIGLLTSLTGVYIQYSFKSYSIKDVKYSTL